MPERKVLMIAFIFPPLGGSGVQRTAKFVKYLPRCGWLPVVVCADDPDIFQTGLDHTLAAELPPEATIIRTRFLSPLGLRRWLQGVLRITPRTPTGNGSATMTEPSDPSMPRRGSGALRNVFGVVSRALSPFEFPPVDAGLYWALSIIPLCWRLIRKEQADLIYTTSFPYSDHVVGLILKAVTRRPWVADFRDPWTQNVVATNYGWRRRCDGFVEQLILRYADRVIGVTPTQTAGLRSLAPRRDASHFITITNGFDREDFEQSANLKPEPVPDASDTVTIAHIGMVYGGTAMPLLKALSSLGAAAEHIRVLFVGGLAPEEVRWLADNPMPHRLEVIGRVPHEQAIAYMRSASVVLLLLGDQQERAGWLPGKLFEYLACGTPILCIGPEGEASSIIRATGTGCVLPASSVPAIADALRFVAQDVQDFVAQHYHPDHQAIAAYERAVLTRSLANVFDSLVPDMAR